MEDKKIDPRIVEARNWRKDQNKIIKQQNRLLAILGPLVMLATIFILTVLWSFHKIGNGKNLWLSGGIFWGGVTIMVILQIIMAVRYAKRNREDENWFYKYLDDMPKPEETKPHTEIVEG